MNQTIKLDTRKREGNYGEARIAPLRRGERNNALLTVKICANGQPYDLVGKTASLVATTAAGKLVGPCPMEVAEAGIARIMLPAALYSAVGAFSGYIEIREGETLVDTTDSFGGKVIECADLDSEQAAEFTPLLGELQNAVAEEAKRVEAEKARAQAEIKRETGFAEAKQASQAATEAANDAATEAKKAAGSASDAAKSANTAAGKATNAAAKAESDVRAFVNAAGTAVGDAIAAAREDVDAAVKRSDAATAKAEAAVETADSANAAATKAVTDAQAAIADVKATEAKLYPVAENILVGSETGAVAHVEDAFAGATLRKITVEGACKQDGIPSQDAPKPITVVENPVVKVVGRNLWSFASSCTSIKGHQNEFVKDGTPFTILPGAYTFSAVGSLGNTDAPLFGYTATGKRIQLFRIMRNVTNPKHSFTVTEPITSVYFVSNAADSNTGTISSIQLERNSTATEYKPHTSQTLPFTLPAEHPYLAKLPDGTADEIVVDEEGNVELVARVAKVLPSEQVISFAEDPNGASYVSFKFANISAIGKKLISNSYVASQWTNKSGYIYCPNDNDVVIRDSRFTTKEKAIELLNGVVVYLAVEPTRYSLGKIEVPKAQDSIVNAWTDAEVTPNTSISYVRDVNIVVANLESAIASITEG